MKSKHKITTEWKEKQSSHRVMNKDHKTPKASVKKPKHSKAKSPWYKTKRTQWLPKEAHIIQDTFKRCKMSMKTQKKHREMEPATEVTQMGFSMRWVQNVFKKLQRNVKLQSKMSVTTERLHVPQVDFNVRHQNQYHYLFCLLSFLHCAVCVGGCLSQLIYHTWEAVPA